MKINLFKQFKVSSNSYFVEIVCLNFLKEKCTESKLESHHWDKDRESSSVCGDRGFVRPVDGVRGVFKWCFDQKSSGSVAKVSLKK